MNERINRKFILAVVTTRRDRVIGGTAAFSATPRGNEHVRQNLEAILDGIAHGIGDDLYLIVKHFNYSCDLFRN
ncbi:hypothetical protein PO124_16180 [Bacillus licheniformis]|nr:hypothetical protein [Bacillus licheniformis]